VFSEGADPGPEPHPLPAPGVPGASEPPGAELVSLDPRVVGYWRVSSVISSVVLLGLAFFIGGSIVINAPEALPIAVGIWSLLFLFRLWMLWWHPSRAYRAWGYRVDDRVMEIRQGIWFRSITLLPLSRLQHVDLNRGPIERSFGLATLVLFTAGTQHASIPLPGLDAERAAALRDRLVAAGGDDAV